MLESLRIAALARLARAGAAAAALAAIASAPAAADDRVATAWQIQAGTAPLLQAPPPPNPVTICVIDTGVNVTPDLDIVDRRTLVGGGLDDVQALPGQTGHGTAVAHFAAGKVNGWGGAGAFPGARITAVRVFSSSNGGAKWQDYVNGMDWCQKADPANTKVMTISLGGSDIAPDEAAELENRINVERDAADINVVVAAGNGRGETDFPGRFPKSFTVAAIGAGGSLCDFSARGANIDIVAPGCSVTEAGWDGEIWQMNGTSFAAPIVAGALAAVRAYAPQLSAAGAEDLLLRTARPGRFPELDVSAALRAIGRGDLVDRFQTADSSSASESPQPHAGGAPLAASPVQGRVAGPARLTKRAVRPNSPHISVRRRAHGRVVIRASNRPPGAILEVRFGGRTIGRQAATVSLRMGKARGLRARYLTDDGSSSWTRTTIGPA